MSQNPRILNANCMFLDSPSLLYLATFFTTGLPVGNQKPGRLAIRRSTVDYVSFTNFTVLTDNLL